MKLPSWLLPVIVIAFVAIRIVVGIRMGAAERKRTGKDWFQSVPIWIKGLWVLLAIAVVALFVWAPSNSGPTSPNQSADPTPAPVTSAAGQPTRQP